MNLWKGRQWFKFWMCENVISWMSSMKIECPRSWRLIHNIFFSIKWEYNWRVLAWDEMRCYRIQQLPVFYCNSVTKQYNYTIIHKITDIMTTNARCFFLNDHDEDLFCCILYYWFWFIIIIRNGAAMMGRCLMQVNTAFNMFDKFSPP